LLKRNNFLLININETMKNILTFSLFVFLLGSLASCKSDKGTKATIGEKTTAATAVGANYTVNTAASSVLWEGSKPAGSHNGVLSISNGNVAVNNGTITGGKFTLDMNSINVLDLEGDQKAYLESHLKGATDKNADDFFNVNKYPTATFEISKVTSLNNDPEGSHLIYGNLTLKEITKQVGFKAKVELASDQIKVSTPKFNIDRTEWGIKYGSGKFFDNLKDKVISDDISLNINLVAGK